MEQRVTRLLTHPRLPLLAALLGVLLASPSLAIGFHLDDHIHRYMLGELPGARALRAAYESPFGIANGEPASNLWQVEQGLSPFWVYPQLRVSLWRPLSELSHVLDVALWPSSAFAMHLHSLAWLALLLVAAALLYRRVLGAGMLAGLAGLLFAFDHNHGFAIGWIANRNALIAASLGVLSLLVYLRARAPRRRQDVRAGATERTGTALRWVSAALFAAALLAGEASVAVFAYVLGHALFLERGSAWSRLRGLAPHLLVLIGWRVCYRLLERGAFGSGIYVDATAEPLRFLSLLPERLPLLWLGQLLLPPPELSAVLPAPLPTVVYAVGLLVLPWSVLAAIPLLRRDATARFWAFGAAAALLIACSTFPHSRLLFFVGLGIVPLLCQLWHGLLVGAPWVPERRLLRGAATALIAPAMGVHLFLSPLLSPVTACSVGFASAPVERGLRQLGALVGPDTELVVLSAPEYFYVKLLPAVQALSGRAGPARLRALGFGPVPITVERLDDHTLQLSYAGGILRDTFSQLYRDPRLPMRVGERVRLDGVEIEITGVTADGRMSQARARFERSLDAAELRFVYWTDAGFAELSVPALAHAAHLPPAALAIELPGGGA